MKYRVTRALVSLGVSIGATLIALGISMVIIGLSGAPPMDAARAMWDGAFGSTSQIAGTLSKMVPLMLVALGWIVAFSTKRINIGFEGQILMGGVVATFIGLHRGGLPPFIHLPLAIAGAVVGGAALAGIAAWLWAKRSVNEIISTLMLNFLAIQLVSWLVRGPMQERTHTFFQSDPIESGARWPHLIANTALSWDLFLALAIVALTAFMLDRTTFGVRLRLTGANEEAARHAGVRTTRMTVLALLISGGLAGLAGSSLILAGESTVMVDNFSAGYGFDGIVVALLARNSPVAVIPSALLFAALRQGGGLMQARVGVSSALTLITQATVILLVAGAQFLFERVSSVRVDARAPARKAGASEMAPVP